MTNVSNIWKIPNFLCELSVKVKPRKTVDVLSGSGCSLVLPGGIRKNPHCLRHQTDLITHFQEYELYFENELKNRQSPIYKTTSLDSKSHKSTMLPTINYINERKCPIYVHNIRKNSSVYNHYNEKFTTAKKPNEANKQVLDKLEETYWSTWRPKKETHPIGQKLALGKSDSKPEVLEHKGAQLSINARQKSSSLACFFFNFISHGPDCHSTSFLTDL